MTQQLSSSELRRHKKPHLKINTILHSNFRNTKSIQFTHLEYLKVTINIYTETNIFINTLPCKLKPGAIVCNDDYPKSGTIVL